MLAEQRRISYRRTDFLAWEAAQAERFEYVGGVIKMMAGGTADHNLIAGNIFAALHGRLRGGPCTPFQQNMKLTPDENEDSTYPDILVTCRPIAGNETGIAAATVLVEVTSPSTRQDDADRKWLSYQQISDLRHYAIVSQDTAEILLYSRFDTGGVWSYQRIAGLSATLALPAIGAELSLGEIYAGTRTARREADRDGGGFTAKDAKELFT
jgi:Uma2 family endonuclease